MAEDQIRLVIRTFRDRLPTEIFPGRTEVPKTLVFAKDDSHAEDIIRIVREEFGKGNDFCQKITYKTTGKKPEDLLADFRNIYNPRIAVTVDMIATGTDVKPLECLLFMRNVKSAAYFEQMKGRGVPGHRAGPLQVGHARRRAKTHFVIVDAVGVSEQDKTASKPLDRQPLGALDKIWVWSPPGWRPPTSFHPRVSARPAGPATDEPSNTAGHPEGGRQGSMSSRRACSAASTPTPRQQRARRFGLPEGPGADPGATRAGPGRHDGGGAEPLHDPKLRDLLVNLKRSHGAGHRRGHAGRASSRRGSTPGPGEGPGAHHELQGLHRDAQGRTRSDPDPLQPPLPGGAAVPSGQRPRRGPQEPAALATPERVWQAFEATEPEAVKGKGGKSLVT